MDIKRRLSQAIKEYNKYRSPEATAKLLDYREDEFIVEFRGPFCKTCGFYDWFDDLRYILLEEGLETRIDEIRELDDGGIVKYRIEKYGRRPGKKR